MSISGTMHTSPRLAFVGCESSAGASAGAGGGAGRAQAQGRREVVVSGKRVKTIDVHAHCIVPEAAQLINHPLEAPGLLWSNLGDRLAQMDHTGVDVEALSINPYWYPAERDAVAELIRVQNEALVEFSPRSRSGSSPLRPRPCNIPTSPPNRLSTRSRRLASAASAWPPASLARISATRNSTRSGPSAKRGGARLPAPAWHPRIGTERPVGREWSPDEHDRQPARNHDRLVASDL